MGSWNKDRIDDRAHIELLRGIEVVATRITFPQLRLNNVFIYQLFF
jgi:hypothetical protein